MVWCLPATDNVSPVVNIRRRLLFVAVILVDAAAAAVVDDGGGGGSVVGGIVVVGVGFAADGVMPEEERVSSRSMSQNGTRTSKSLY